MAWQQVYDPLSNMWLSTLLAAIPVVVMLVGLGFLHMKAHLAAGAGLIAALLIAVFVYNMPGEMAGRAALFGGFTGGGSHNAAWAMSSGLWAGQGAAPGLVDAADERRVLPDRIFVIGVHVLLFSRGGLRHYPVI